MKTHVIKVWPQYFERLECFAKTAEVRRDDRGYQQGDLLKLYEFDPETESFTGRYLMREVTDITCGMGLSDGFVMLSLARI